MKKQERDEKELRDRGDLVADMDAVIFLNEYKKKLSVRHVTTSILRSLLSSPCTCDYLNVGFCSVDIIIERRNDTLTKYPLWYLLRKRKDISSEVIRRSVT